MAISILIAEEGISESTGDWIWRLPHCKDTIKGGSASWCIESADEVIDFMVENRRSVLSRIKDQLTNDGFDPDLTFSEWITGLSQIKEIAAVTSGDCTWTAMPADADPQQVEMNGEKFLEALDLYGKSIRLRKRCDEDIPPP